MEKSVPTVSVSWHQDTATRRLIATLVNSARTVSVSHHRLLRDLVPPIKTAPIINTVSRVNATLSLHNRELAQPHLTVSLLEPLVSLEFVL